MPLEELLDEELLEELLLEELLLEELEELLLEVLPVSFAPGEEVSSPPHPLNNKAAITAKVTNFINRYLRL